MKNKIGFFLFNFLFLASLLTCFRMENNIKRLKCHMKIEAVLVDVPIYLSYHQFLMQSDEENKKIIRFVEVILCDIVFNIDNLEFSEAYYKEELEELKKKELLDVYLGYLAKARKIIYDQSAFYKNLDKTIGSKDWLRQHQEIRTDRYLLMKYFYQRMKDVPRGCVDNRNVNYE